MKVLKVNSYATPQLKEITLCISDLVMGTNTPAKTINKLVGLIYKESYTLKRTDIIEYINLNSLIS